MQPVPRPSRLLPILFAAAALSPAASTTAQQDERDAPARGVRTLEVYGIAGQGFHQELSRGQGFSEFGGLGLAFGKGISRKVELSLDLHPLTLIRQPAVPPHGRRETVASFALDVGARWFPVRPWAGVLPFAELLAGPSYSVRRVPTRGTRFNFMTQTAFGATARRAEGWSPYAAARWVHISNAGTGQHNPDWDYWAVAIGGRLTLKRR